jgi:hypothetical protein
MKKITENNYEWAIEKLEDIIAMIDNVGIDRARGSIGGWMSHEYLGPILIAVDHVYFPFFQNDLLTGSEILIKGEIGNKIAQIKESIK